MPQSSDYAYCGTITTLELINRPGAGRANTPVRPYAPRLELAHGVNAGYTCSIVSPTYPTPDPQGLCAVSAMHKSLLILGILLRAAIHGLRDPSTS